MQATIKSAALALILCALSTAATAEDFPPEARERLDHAIGKWHMTIDVLDEEGGITRSFEAMHEAEYLIGNRVVLITTHHADGSKSKAFQFYSMSEETYYLIDVNEDGDLWILSGGLDQYLITSQPKAMQSESGEAREAAIRFRHLNVTENSFDATMEYTVDGGITWILNQRQHLRRIAE